VLLDDITDTIPKLHFDASPTKPVVLASLTPPAAVDALVEEDAPLAPPVLVGIASTYNPHDPTDTTAGGMETASGELYDISGWTAAIRTDLRDRFGGVRYGRNYKPTFALVECDGKSVIIKINDVGPLRPGRIIDLNRRTMHFFDPTLRLGLLDGVSVTPLDGTDWKTGPFVDGAEEPITLAGDFAL
jgi:rare lipoprotein A